MHSAIDSYIQMNSPKLNDVKNTIAPMGCRMTPFAKVSGAQSFSNLKLDILMCMIFSTPFTASYKKKKFSSSRNVVLHAEIGKKREDHLLPILFKAKHSKKQKETEGIWRDSFVHILVKFLKPNFLQSNHSKYPFLATYILQASRKPTFKGTARN